jgi:hypothetical protein
MREIVILVARRRDYDHRDHLWEYCRAWWIDNFPNYRIFEGFHEEDGPFNRSIALNRASDLAGDWKIAIIVDADVILDRPNSLYEAIRAAIRGRIAAAFNVRNFLSRDATDAILAEVPFKWDLYTVFSEENSVSGALAIHRDLWDKVNGFDENFIGFGYEDLAFIIACETLSEQRIYRADDILWHLWHEKSLEDNPKSPGLLRNKERWLDYISNQYSPRRIKELTQEVKEVR